MTACTRMLLAACLALAGGASVQAQTPPLRLAGSAVLEGNEGQTPMSFRFVAPNLSPPPGYFPLRLRYATVGGSATPGSDYLPVQGELTLTWPPPFPDITVMVLGDTLVEGNETVVLRVESILPSPLVLSAEGSIVDDDGVTPPPPRPLLVPVDGRVLEPRVGSVEARLAVRLLRTGNLQPVATVRVGFEVTGGTATPGADYIGPAAGVLEFPPGTTLREIPFQILADNLAEAIEFIRVRFRDPVGAVLARDTAELTIADASSITPVVGGVALIPCRPFVLEGEQAEVLARRVGTLAQPLGVGYTTVDGSAQAGSDYTATSGMLHWDAGDGSHRLIRVPTLTDDVDEGDERFFVTLLNSATANVVGGRAMVVIRDADGLFVDDLENLCHPSAD